MITAHAIIAPARLTHEAYLELNVPVAGTVQIVKVERLAQARIQSASA